MAGDIIAFLDALEIGQVTLVGHSYGSFVARHIGPDDDEVRAMLTVLGYETLDDFYAAIGTRGVEARWSDA